MFENMSASEQLRHYEFVRKKAKKFGKLYGTVSVFFVALIGLVALLSGNTSVGTLVLITAVAVMNYFTCYQIGKCYPWSYYWLSSKCETPLPLIVTLFLGFYIGLALRIKYHNFHKKIQ